MKKTSPKSVVKKVAQSPKKAAPKKASVEFVVTDIAVTQLKKLAKEAKQVGSGIKIDVTPGGCAGFQYYMDFQKKADTGDIEMEQGGMKIFINTSVVEFLKGTTLDYVESLSGSGFSFKNPNVRSSCHCGKSVC